MSHYEKNSKAQLIEELQRLQDERDTATSHRDDALQLRHELEVHQIELEMQNRELREKQRELELARDKYADLYDFAPLGYLTLDAQGKILDINLTAACFLERNRSHLLNIPFTSFLAPDYSQDFLKGLRQTLKTDKPRTLELQLRNKTKDAANLTVKLHMAAWTDGGRPVVRVALVDVTEQRKAEQAVRRHLEEAARLQRLEVAHELATLLAHELNQPLGAITLFADTSLQQLGRLSSDEVLLENNLQRIREQAMRGGEIIRRLRAFLGRAEINAIPLDLNAVLVNTCGLIKPALEDADIRLEFALCDALPAVMGVQVHLEQVLLNLLSNALEAIRDAHMTAGWIKIETHRQQHGACVSVRDNGPGIGPEAAGKLFESLYTSKPNGLGVGLCISRSLIEFHGGRLWVEAHQPGGVFHFEVPYAP